MDKNILKKFAIESRQDLMQKIENKIKLFFVDETFSKQQNGDVYVLSNEKHTLSLSKEDYDKRELLIKRIQELGIEQVIEEAAYTWFNRIVAIRYMEINDYLPLTKDNQSLGIRVLSSKDNTPDPEIMKFTNLVNSELDIDFKKEKYVEIKDDNEKFKYVLLLVCKKLGKVIPQVFDGITDYIDILIPDNLLNDTGFITKIVTEVPEDNYNQVEIIGWLYQYYNQTEKDRVMAAKKAYKKNEIPYATQLFTPDWIVKYMVENSLGKYWVEHSNNDSIIENWKYFIKDNIEKLNEKVNPTEITFIDPCCGSGHILVYAFEVLYQIYVSVGYNKNDIPELILTNNLYGLDIDDRAGQLSILSILLKTREYDKNIFNKEIVRNLNIMSIQESNSFSDSITDNILNDKLREKAKYLIENMKNAKEIGSLLKLENIDYTELEQCIYNNNTIFGIELKDKIVPLIKCAKILSNKYDIVVTNPPYMSNGVMGNILKEYLSKKYNDSKMDLCNSFMELDIVNDNGYLSMINQHSWMYLFSFENLRKKIIENKSIVNMLHLGTRAFEEIGGEVVQTTTFVMKNIKTNNKTMFIELNNIDNSIEKENAFLKYKETKEKTYYHNLEEFLKVPGYVFVFQANEKTINLFENKKLGDVIEVATGLSTSDNNRFLRLWHEVDYNNIEFNANLENSKKWFPMAKGGNFRKWYGNLDYIINWQYNGKEIKEYAEQLYKCSSRTIKNTKHYFKEGITWSALTTGNLSMRYMKNSIFGSGASCAFVKEDLYKIMGLLNSELVNYFMSILNPTLNVNVTDMVKIPYLESENKSINDLVIKCIELSKKDWNKRETSYEFEKPYFIDNFSKSLKEAINKYIGESKENAENLRKYEEDINKYFIELYGLNDEVNYRIQDKYISCSVDDEKKSIKSLISYTVGCMFGRYSLDEDGLIYAGGDFDINRYKRYKPDIDNIIPITDESYFGDDIVVRFKDFIRTVYGRETFNENLDFIAEALGKKGTETSEDTIRRYFNNDFYADHIKMYQKKPIYWLFDSGKKNGFKALVYMHRYNENTVPKVRLDYLHRIQTTYEKLLTDINYKLTTELSMNEKKEVQKRQTDLNAKLQEIKEYDEKIAHIANQRISIDLDDGVTINYAKFADILAKIK